MCTAIMIHSRIDIMYSRSELVKDRVTGNELSFKTVVFLF